MTLTGNAYVEIEADTNATFQLKIGYDNQSQASKSYLMGERGQYLREIVNQTPGTGSFDADRRTGFWLDGGAGDWQETFNFQVGVGGEDIQWGDSSGSRDQSGVTKTDASGTEVEGISRKNVLDYWLAKSKSDSGGDTRIHFGEWTDGTITHISGVSSAAFGQPMPVAVREWQASLSGAENDPVGQVTGSITVSHVALWGGAEAPAWVDDAVGAVLDAGELIPDA